MFFAWPKAGTVSMHALLDPYSDPSVSGDQTPPGAVDPHVLPIDFARTIELSKYKTFTLVRNPWERLVSLYEWKRAGALEQFPAFSGWLLNVLPHDSLPANRLTGCEFGSGLVNRTIRLEDIESELPGLLDWIGLPNVKMQHLNRNEHPPYESYYDVPLREFVALKHAKDIEAFDYRFDR